MKSYFMFKRVATWREEKKKNLENYGDDEGVI